MPDALTQVRAQLARILAGNTWDRLRGAQRDLTALIGFIDELSVGETPGAAEERVEAKLTQFAALKAGWDSYGGAAISPVAIQRARDWLATVQAVPCSNGGVQLEWHRDRWDVEIRIHTDGSASVFADESVGAAPAASGEPDSVRLAALNVVAVFDEAGDCSRTDGRVHPALVEVIQELRAAVIAASVPPAASGARQAMKDLAAETHRLGLYEDEKAAASGARETLESLIAEALEWQAATFPHRTLNSVSAHLLREATELRAYPSDPEEMADVFLLLASLADMSNVNLADAVAAKLAKNKARQWGNPDADGVCEHVKPASVPSPAAPPGEEETR